MKKAYLFTLIIISIISISCKKTETSNSNYIENIKDNINIFTKLSDGFEYTKLGLACKNNNLANVKELISKGADINIAKKDDIYEYDALSVAIENNHYEIVKFLINEKADVNKVYNEDGLTTIGLATKLNQKEIVELLLKNHANPNGSDVSETDYKEAPLLIAVQNNNIIIAKLLIDSGASINDIDKDGNTIKSLISSKGRQWENLVSANAQKLLKFNGEYFAENDKLSDYGISLNFKNDSIIYTEIGNMGKTYNQYLLKVSLTENNKIYLKYDKTLNGYTVNANKGNYFGIVTSEQKALLFESEYLSEKFNVDKTFMNK
ncbi:MAG: ankyrin repeat domain-containing protein [Chryseobacterium sp.]|uniref:ankyrin repeat domain-containing protein n=1 Tax=Chryseobacterium sp. TaxID=1871047 RepID=UPI001B11027B|nr:ankyrin repeat domain-containing protein [Chryseobacterium sp.]MBO6185920.1 ankyrin repeat domain-containing protein [Chryseobacterium sp.]